MVGVPVHVPRFPVSVLPTYGWPEIVGRDVLTGGVGVGSNSTTS